MKEGIGKDLVVGLIFAILIVSVIIFVNFRVYTPPKQTRTDGTIPFSFTVGSIHTTITIIKNGEKILEEYHAGAVTQLGLNFTFAKLTGNSTLYNMTQYNLNLTDISIGNQGTLTTASTILPGEWNRTTALAHDGTYNSCNFTAVFHPGTGPYTADCIGLNFQTGIGQTNSLWGYDTFSEVTGIDNTFTITVEIKVSAS